MNISEFSFKIMLLALPGFFAFIIIDRLTTHKEAKLHHWVIYTFLLGVLSYTLWSVVTTLLSLKFSIPDNFAKIDDLLSISNTLPPYPVILGTSFIAAPCLGLVITRAINYKWMTKFAKKVKVSNKYEEIDLLQHILNMSDAELSRWVVVRDYERNIMYDGYIEAYADPNEILGLFLRNVRVYRQSESQNPETQAGETSENSTPPVIENTFFYEIDAMYLPIRTDKMIIEFPPIVKEETEDEKCANQ